MLQAFFSLCLVAAAQPAANAPIHLFESLLDPGLVVGPGIRVKLPQPRMPDGLDAAKQKAVILELIGNDYSYEEFTRKSVVAPNLLRIGDAKASDPNAPARTVDVYFVAYGDFRAIEDEKFREQLLASGKGSGKAKTLTPDDLAKRKIVLSKEAAQSEGYGAVEFDFLDKVRLKVTGHAAWGKSSDSLIAAVEVDPLFRGDGEFGNEWQSLAKIDGALVVSAPQPYEGAGMYVKVTKLIEPAGAMFIEQHIVFAEPTSWFNGANLLRSKLPPVMQINVRNMRKEWVKGVGK